MTVFADTGYFVALIGPRDEYHGFAKSYAERIEIRIVTSEFVLVELGNFLGGTPARSSFPTLYSDLKCSARTEIIPASTRLFEAAVALFEERPDKAWSLVDCSSFRIMQERGITHALAFDRHFEQAGFRLIPTR